MNGVVTIHFRGRLGNQMMQYAFARAYAERIQAYFLCPPWMGDRIFAIERQPLPANQGHRQMLIRNEFNVLKGQSDVLFQTYAQSQDALLYTLAQFRAWFTFRPEIRDALEKLLPTPDHCCAHRRVGDYPKHGYPTVSRESYEHFATLYGIPEIIWVTEENPTTSAEFQGELAMLPDFFRLMRAGILLRANSTFSWCAACLNTEGKIFSPVIDELPFGAKDSFCRFVKGNHPRLAVLPDVTNLHFQP